MAQLTTEALDHFAAHHGIASTAVLLQCGLTTHGIRDLVESGNLAIVLSRQVTRIINFLAQNIKTL